LFTLFAVLLSAAALLAVAYPVLARTRTAAPSAVSASEKLAELLAQRDAAFAALRDLNFDHRVGKITDEDFVAFEAHLKGVAADALAALDEWEAAADRALGEVVTAQASQPRAQAGGRACPECGQWAEAEDKFCAACGAALPAARVCGKCGRSFLAGDRFCAGCGQPVG
jgi:hypothetical protein